jgi:hypothetical protein
MPDPELSEERDKSQGRFARKNVASTSCLSTPLCVATNRGFLSGYRLAGAMIWNRDASRGGFICSQADVTTLLIDLVLVPVFAEDLNDRAGFSRGKNFVTHQTETEMRTASL